MHERESSAVELRGEITEIIGLDRYSFPEFKTEYVYDNKNGVQLIINGVKCTAVTQGTFEVGDKVIIMYLPRSGYVLEIHPNDF